MVSSKDSASVPAPGATPPILPPSVEEAYKKKCIELKRRIIEVEESNDTYRLRKVRLTRGIRKLRIERAILLETLGKRMRKNGSGGLNAVYDDESEGSSEGPPTPQEKPLRSKRGHRRPAQSPHSAAARHALSHPTTHLQHHSSSYSTPIAPHPGPTSFSHTNGSATGIPTPAYPLSTPHSVPYATYNRPGPSDMPPKPPSAMDRFIQHAITMESPRNRNLRLTMRREELSAYYVTLWQNLPPREREGFEREEEDALRAWEAEVVVWEEGRRRTGEEEEEEDEGGDMEGVEGEGEGGFTAVNG